jgi:hypothetical protein
MSTLGGERSRPHLLPDHSDGSAFPQISMVEEIFNHSSNAGVCFYWYIHGSQMLFIECGFPAAVSWYYVVQVTEKTLNGN